jgi:microcystin-dependent protein
LRESAGISEMEFSVDVPESYDWMALAIRTLAQQATSLPGQIITWAADTPPDGYFECDGTEIERDLYPELFSAIGTTFGVGDGSTTFALPDLRGEFVRGWDNGRGVDVGRGVGSSQLDALQSHSHELTAYRDYIDLNGVARRFSIESDASAHATDSLSGGADYSARSATETRPRNIALMYCIKY